MSADIMPCGCEGHADNEEMCKYPALAAKLRDTESALAALGKKATSLENDREYNAGLVKDAQARIAAALNYAVRYGGIDGDHHKTWVIDQVVRALTGCPEEINHGTDVNGKPYTYRAQGKSHEYLDLVRKACDGEDGPNTYDWDEGIAP